MSSRTPKHCKVIARASDREGYEVVVYKTITYTTTIICPNKPWGKNLKVGTTEDCLREFHKEVKAYALDIVKGAK